MLSEAAWKHVGWSEQFSLRPLRHVQDLLSVEYSCVLPNLIYGCDVCCQLETL